MSQTKSSMRKELESMLEAWQVELLGHLVDTFYSNLGIENLSSTEDDASAKWEKFPEPLRKSIWSLLLPFLGRLAASALGATAGRLIGGAIAGTTGATWGAQIGRIIGMLGGWDAVKQSLSIMLGRENPMRLLETLSANFPQIAQFVNFLRGVSPQLVQQFATWLKDNLQRFASAAPSPAGEGTAPTQAMAKALMGVTPPYFSKEEEAEILMPLFAQFLKEKFLEPPESNS